MKHKILREVIIIQIYENFRQATVASAVIRLPRTWLVMVRRAPGTKGIMMRLLMKMKMWMMLLMIMIIWMMPSI